MASASFMSDNQSFSEANSSWASLIVDQVQSTLEDEGYANILDFDSVGANQSTPVKGPGHSKQHVDMRTFEQILQVMIQQGAALDRLREELDQYRQECKQELEYRDARLHLAEKELRSLSAEKEIVVSELQVLEEELGALKATQEDPASPDILTREEHDRIVRRVKDDARVRIENAKAEKSHLTVQLSRLQIQAAQLKNQLDDKNYPDEVIEDLTKTLRYTIIETCKNADVDARAVKQELSATQEELSRREREFESVCIVRDAAEDKIEQLETQLEELHGDYDAVQERLAILESMQGQVESTEAALKEAEEQVEQLQGQLSDIEKSRNIALMDCEQLRALLKEAKDGQSTLIFEVQAATNASIQANERISELQRERDASLAENEQLRSRLENPEEREAALSAEVEQLKRDLEGAEEQRERAERIFKEAENELRVARERADELNKALLQEQVNCKASDIRCSELQNELQTSIETSAKELAEKVLLVDEAKTHAGELQAKLDDEKEKLSSLRDEYAETARRLTERADSADSELQRTQESLRETEERCTQEELRLEENAKTLKGTQNQCTDLQDRLKKAETGLETANKLQSEAESELQRFIETSNAQLEKVTLELQTQIDVSNASLASAKAENTRESELRKEMAKTAEEEKARLLEEIRKLEKELKAVEKRLAKSETVNKDNQVEVKAKEEQIDELREALGDAEKGRKDAMRENEQIRLKHAEAESNRAEADILNEELRQKISEVEKEAKKLPSVESDLANTQAQLDQAIESMTMAKGEASKYLAEIAQQKAEIAELRMENEHLITARRQMAAIYGLSAEPLSSPRHTPTRATPTRRNSQSLSPSTSSGPLQLVDHPAPAPKRRRVSKLATKGVGPSGAAVAPGSSPVSAILLDENDENVTASPSTPSSKDKNSIHDVPKYLIDIYSTFAKLVSWHNESGTPVCGLCALHNRYNDKDRRAPLQFDPSQYPITFWSHCQMLHKNALRPDIDIWLQDGGRTLPLSNPSLVLAKFISWRLVAGKYACGLCEIEKIRRSHNALDFDPCAELIAFWSHCHQEHVPFWKSISQE